MKNLQPIYLAIIAILVGIIAYPKFHDAGKSPEIQKADATPVIEQLRPLEAFLGEWKGDGDGKIGISTAEKTISQTLNGCFILIHSRQEFPVQEKNQKGESFESYTYIGYDEDLGQIIMREFDNTSLVGTYVLDEQASTASQLVFVSEDFTNLPRNFKREGFRARMIFQITADNEYREIFELDRDGSGFSPFIVTNLARADS